MLSMVLGRLYAAGGEVLSKSAKQTAFWLQRRAMEAPTLVEVATGAAQEALGLGIAPAELCAVGVAEMLMVHTDTGPAEVQQRCRQIVQLLQAP